VDGLVSLVVMVEANPSALRSEGLYWIGLGLPNPWLLLDGVKDLVNGEPQWSEILFHQLMSSE